MLQIFKVLSVPLSAVGRLSNSPSVLILQSCVWSTSPNSQASNSHIRTVTVNWISAEQLMFTSCRCVGSTYPLVFCIWLLHHLRAWYSCIILFIHEYSTPNICLRLHTGIWSHFAINNGLFLEICTCLRWALWFCLAPLKTAFSVLFFDASIFILLLLMLHSTSTSHKTLQRLFEVLIFFDHLCVL